MFETLRDFKIQRNNVPFVIGAIFSTLLLSACTGTRPVDIGINNNQLTPCPSSSNCVSSFEIPTDETHYIKPYQSSSTNPEKAWELLQQIVTDNDSAEIISKDSNYIHAEFTSSIMRYVDDTEFMLDTDNNLIQLRSASRLGLKDFGVNRDRLEAIRTQLQSKGAIE